MGLFSNTHSKSYAVILLLIFSLTHNSKKPVGNMIDCVSNSAFIPTSCVQNTFSKCLSLKCDCNVLFDRLFGCFHEIFGPLPTVLISLNKIAYLHIYMSSIIFMVLLVTLNNALDRVWNF